MKFHDRTYLFILIITASCLISFALVALAEENIPEFQESTQDFIKALEFKGARPKSILPPEALAKGPAMIAYDELTNNPTARSKIHFEFDSDAVQESSYQLLQNLAEALTTHYPEATLVIAGHTDSTGPEEYNLSLSQRRAQAVKQLLVETFSIRAERLLLRWFGETQPMLSNKSAEDRSKNRRVEFIRLQ